MPLGKIIGYVRVSTVDQNPERQLEGIELDKKFVDYASGSSRERPQLNALIDYAREDDTIIIHSMDRLGRRIQDIRSLVDEWMNKGVQVQFVRENLRFSGKADPMANCILNILGAVAEFEHSLIRERQLEGVAIAKKAGKFKGSKKKLGKEQLEWLKNAISSTRMSKSQMATHLGICRVTLYQYLRQLAPNLPKTSTPFHPHLV